MKFLNFKLFSLWKKSETEKAEEMLQMYMKHLPKLRKIMNEGYDPSSEDLIEKQMYDFFENWDNSVDEHNAQWDHPMIMPVMNVEPGEKRIAKTPVDALKELETIPTPFTCDQLDETISLFKDKHKLTNQRYTRDQIDGFVQRLENRRKYKDHYKFYNKFPNTNDEKIDTLLAKYKLVMKKSHLFVPTFPKEAIEIMKEYTEMTKKVTKEKPVFYVIAEEKDFQKKERRLDPILLVQSPFGFFWQILGAWSKEMLLLHEL